MKLQTRLLALGAALTLTFSVHADHFVAVDVDAGDGAAQNIFDEGSKLGPGDHLPVNINRGPGGELDVNFGELNFGGVDQVFSWNNIEVNFVAGSQVVASGEQIVFNGGGFPGRFATLNNSTVRAFRINFTNFHANGHGGVFAASGDSTVDLFQSTLVDASASGSGGGIFAEDGTAVIVSESQLYNLSANQNGGGIALHDNATAHAMNCIMSGNMANEFGHHVHVESKGVVGPDTPFLATGCQFSDPNKDGPGIHVPIGGAIMNAILRQSQGPGQGDGIWATQPVILRTSVLTQSEAGPLLQGDSGDNRPEVLCEDFGSGSFDSLGFNIAEDGSCALNQSTDLPNTDAMMATNANGIVVPQPGSPAIESGPAEVVVFPGESRASLPCGYKDLLGVARPQDSNDDGVFECDRGAMEVAGPGALTPGHSAAFFDLNTDGMGQYVEMLNANTAVVYTFTARPDGSGSAWFIGVGYVLGNSIVIDQVLRPSGTSFGDGFDSSEIVNAFAGGQNMVFNDCAAAAPGGNVVYSGNRALGYEAMINRAQRLSNILGCGAETPHENAGLSGSYFLPTRNGEGIVVQWLPDGQVLVIFFTYDLNGDQQWVIGIGQSDGFSVTMDALYASSNSVWGSDFDPAEVDLSPWGTFELIWTECGGVQFSYNSTVSGYGSATRQYIRLSTLWETTCPSF